jgi:hypothetical protein
MEERLVFVQVPRRDIALLCHFVAGYEGVAIVRTVDASQGGVVLLVAPAFWSTACTLLHALAQEMDVQILEAPLASWIMQDAEDFHTS